MTKIDGFLKSQIPDGFVKSAKFKAGKSRVTSRTYSTSQWQRDEAQRRNWTFFEAVIFQAITKPAQTQQKHTALMGLFPKILISIMITFLFGSCAPVLIKTPPSSPPFSQNDIIQIATSFRHQKKWVDTFFCSGRLAFKGKDSEAESNLLLACIRDPFRLKIEITHPWGSPVLHILIHESTFHILSFQDKQYSIGKLGNSLEWKFFPMTLNPDQLFGITRGYPVLQEHADIVSRKANQITLLDNAGKSLQVIDFLPESALPYLVSFPQQDLQISFLDFQKQGDIYYAPNISLNDAANENTLVLNLKQMVFNKPISEDFFVLEIPHDFATNQIRRAKGE